MKYIQNGKTHVHCYYVHRVRVRVFDATIDVDINPKVVVD